MIAAFISLINFLLLISFILLLTNRQFAQPFLILFFLKSIADFFMLYSFTRFFKTKYLLFLLLPAQIFVTLYSALIAFISPFGNPTWKGRKVQ